MKIARVLTWVLLLVVLSVMPALEVVGQTGSGGVHGVVLNGTLNGVPVSDQEVVLITYRDGAALANDTTRSDELGAYVFSGLGTDASLQYVIYTEYQNVTYSVSNLAFGQGQTELATDVMVYEVTSDPVDISVPRAHIFIGLDSGAVKVTEFYVFENAGTRTYVGVPTEGSRPATSSFALPTGAFDGAFADGALGGRYYATDVGFDDTEPRWPGTTTVIYSYGLTCTDGRCDLGRQCLFDVQSLNVLVPAAGVQVVGPHLTSQAQVETEQGTYDSYLLENVRAGSALELELVLPQESSAAARLTGAGRPRWPWLLGGALLVGLAMAYPLWQKPGQPARSPSTSGARREKCRPGE